MYRCLKGEIVINSILDAISEFWQVIIELIRGFRIIDFVDIFIVATLIYGLIKLVRETRAGQLVKGLLIFIIVFIISNMMELSMVNTLLKYFFQSAFIAILIVFQPEIRKALEQMGRSSVGKSIASVVSSKDNDTTEKDTKKAIDSMVEAFVTLQKLKMGALVIFERQTKLGEIIETGTMVDATSSAKMIANIFFNKAPLHDGAMVIRNGRILSAGCILPLTKNDTISESVGTRHRAALGMSEESDAVVVVLSEETGQFSTALDGKLVRNYTKDTLRSTLYDYLLKKDDKQNGERKKRSILIKRKER